MFRKTDYQGEFQVDHRASPGINRETAERMGLDPQLVGEGKVFEGATRHCPHCGGCVVLNPKRERHRNHCRSCDKYICDGCAIVAGKPDYQHRTFEQLTEMVTSGRYTLAGGTASEPLLIPNF